MIQQSHSWVYILRTWNQYLEEISAHPCLLEHYLYPAAMEHMLWPAGQGAKPAALPNCRTHPLALIPREPEQWPWAASEPNRWYHLAAESSLQSHVAVEASMWPCQIAQQSLQEHSQWPYPVAEHSQWPHLTREAEQRFCPTAENTVQLHPTVGYSWRPSPTRDTTNSFTRQQSAASCLPRGLTQPVAPPALGHSLEPHLVQSIIYWGPNRPGALVEQSPQPCPVLESNQWRQPTREHSLWPCLTRDGCRAQLVTPPDCGTRPAAPPSPSQSGLKA